MQKIMINEYSGIFRKKLKQNDIYNSFKILPTCISATEFFLNFYFQQACIYLSPQNCLGTRYNVSRSSRLARRRRQGAQVCWQTSAPRRPVLGDQELASRERFWNQSHQPTRRNSGPATKKSKEEDHHQAIVHRGIKVPEEFEEVLSHLCTFQYN